jgi:hypothetical protein
MVGLLLMSAWVAAAAEFPPGQIIDAVKCAADPSQSYGLYLPTSHSPDHAWPVILAFDPGARGRIPVERYRAAAEQYGYIVAGSITRAMGRGPPASPPPRRRPMS